MEEMTNDRRADRARYAVDAYVGRDTAEYVHEEDTTKLGDLLCDLMHWADMMGVDFDYALDNGRGNYDAEIDEHNEEIEELRDDPQNPDL